MYLVDNTDAGVVPVGTDVTERTHDETVSTVTHFLPTQTHTESSSLQFTIIYNYQNLIHTHTDTRYIPKLLFGRSLILT